MLTAIDFAVGFLTPISIYPSDASMRRAKGMSASGGALHAGAVPWTRPKVNQGGNLRW